MCELIDTKSRREGYRWQLLASTSAAALLACLYAAGPANAGDGNRSTMWIEIGTQLENVEGGQEPFSPPFFGVEHSPDPWDSVGPATVQRPSRYGVGGEGKLSFVPADSGWVFSAAIRYGRSNRSKVAHQESIQYLHNSHSAQNHLPATLTAPVYAEAKARNRESHAVVDFTVGKDVGLGIFGDDTDTVVSVGVRFAQFASHIGISMYGMPGATVKFGPPPKYQFRPSEHQYSASANVARNFSGVGPSVSWDGSVPFADMTSDSKLTFDWGINAAILIGRQKVQATHQTTEHRYYFNGGTNVSSSLNNDSRPARSRSVVVPNLGGFAGISLKFPNAKVALGYRADTFFGVMDGGIDTRKIFDRGFYGPFATIGIRLGG